MRDIRADLRERLEALAADRVKLQEQLTAVEALEGTFKMALREEEARIAQLSVNRAELPFPRPAAPPNVFVGSAIKEVMKAKNRPLYPDEIREAILDTRSYDFGDKKPGRSIHFGLVSLQNGGEIEKLPDGRIRLLGQNGIPVQETQLAQ